MATSRITRQGQISIPAVVRRRLGLLPGSIIEWDSDGEQVIVRRAGRVSSEEMHRAIFGQMPPKRRSFTEMEERVAAHLAEKHARERSPMQGNNRSGKRSEKRQGKPSAHS
ncbi:MAG: AbrB/MazE/SpoVT family DNA-binding domain-containing protein [Candidatus Eisenbacteria bacterium]|nr:AbrB/MazE/SpoVT family DNA-binding domain-containing protein [Candidatus Eisenbacteria bacterium]MCC7142196.1 AbrB/MazE/SpoVT family DNA-binding domain-containing protein [Candidatus Eisenbacteria bacterium]